MLSKNTASQILNALVDSQDDVKDLKSVLEAFTEIFKNNSTLIALELTKPTISINFLKAWSSFSEEPIPVKLAIRAFHSGRVSLEEFDFLCKNVDMTDDANVKTYFVAALENVYFSNDKSEMLKILKHHLSRIAEPLASEMISNGWNRLSDISLQKSAIEDFPFEEYISLFDPSFSNNAEIALATIAANGSRKAVRALDDKSSLISDEALKVFYEKLTRNIFDRTADKGWMDLDASGAILKSSRLFLAKPSSLTSIDLSQWFISKKDSESPISCNKTVLLLGLSLIGAPQLLDLLDMEKEKFPYKSGFKVLKSLTKAYATGRFNEKSRNSHFISGISAIYSKGDSYADFIKENFGPILNEFDSPKVLCDLLKDAEHKLTKEMKLDIIQAMLSSKRTRGLPTQLALAGSLAGLNEKEVALLTDLGNRLLNDHGLSFKSEWSAIKEAFLLDRESKNTDVSRKRKMI